MKMKKLGIITLHFIPNYGAVLQSYALKEVLQSYCDVEIIDYRQLSKEKNISPKMYLKAVISSHRIIDILKFPIRAYKIRYLTNFRKQLLRFYSEKLNLTKQIEKKELYKLNGTYEGIVVGSDQVWSPSVLAGEYTLLLDFYRNKKYSYASSLGVKSIPSGEIEIYQENLKLFTCLSCREDVGTKLINSILEDKICRTVLDPTLLLTRDEWKKKCCSNNIKNKDGILVYLAKYEKNILNIAKKLQHISNNCTLIATPEVYRRLGRNERENWLYNISPEEWIEYFDKAGMVLTNSFHGIAFSINFNKQFYTCFHDAADINGTNSRMENILEIFGLQSRNIADISQIKSNDFIDYKSVNKVLKKEREKSFDYINIIINDFKNENEC